MRIRTFRHAGLRRLYQRDLARGLPPDAVDKLRKMLAFLQDMETEQEVRVDVLRNEAAIRPVLYEETLRSLHAEVKALHAVWLYDARGSRLYDDITRLPE